MNSVPIQCQRCRHVYGRSHGDTMLICGMHATGPAVAGQCEDFEALHIPSGQYRTSRMLPHQITEEDIAEVEGAAMVDETPSMVDVPAWEIEPPTTPLTQWERIRKMQQIIHRIIGGEVSDNGSR